MTEPLDAQPALPPKVDPETLAIRGRPPRAIRFKRGVIVAIAACAAACLILVSWIALKPSVFRQVVAQAEDTSQPDNEAAPEALSALPVSYGDVPKLGPPLPGDLGRPILERQRQLAMASAPDESSPKPQALAAAREQAVAELKAARQSGVLVSNASASGSGGGSSAADLSSPSSTMDGAKLALDGANDPNGQQRKADFAEALDPRGDSNPHGVAAAASPYLLSAGSVVSASLLTGLRSDLPGLVTAQVTEPAYDSPTGRIVLIPQGARLIGEYDSVVAFGQTRALVVWRRIIFPDGSSVRLDNMPASDPSGYAGLADQLDRHTWQLLEGVALSTLLGVGSQLALSGESDLVQEIRMSTQDSVSRAGDQITGRNLQVQPTISIRPGAPVRLLVNRDLILAPWKG